MMTAHSTPYKERFLKFFAHVQENDLTCDGAMTDPKESMHGAGSPQAQRIMISRLVDLKGKQRKARWLCGITTDSGSEEA